MSTGSVRIASLDALRGFAVLGMLVTHVQMFATVHAARFNPTVHGTFAGANWAIWLATYVLADGKFVTLFGMLFGASIVLLAERCETTGRSAARVHYRRMVLLLVLGLAHAYLVWYGDMLVLMAVCGAAVFVYRAMAAGRLLALALSVYAIGATISLVVGLSADTVPDTWLPPPDVLAHEIAGYRGGWLDQMAHRVPTAFALQTSYAATAGLWQMTALMLAGMALFKLGVLTGQASPGVYAAMIAGGFGLGLPAFLAAVAYNTARAWDYRRFVVVSNQVMLWAGPLMACGWMGLVLLVARRGRTPAPLLAVGRMALTNYLMQSLLCTAIFYGHGLGLFARVDRTGQVAVVLAVWAIQLGVSRWWFRRFTLGPIEWLWRAATYARGAPARWERN
jgi:uncharacterized protein